MKHPPAFDGPARFNGQSGPPASATHPSRADQGTDLANQIADRLSSIAGAANVKPPGESLMSRLSGMDPVPATVRVRAPPLPEHDTPPPTSPPSPAPHFAARRELPDTADPAFQITREVEAETPPTGNANDNYPRLLQAVKARKRQRLMAGLRSIGSWLVTLGIAGSIIGSAAFFMIGAHIKFEPEAASATAEQVEVAPAGPVVPAVPTLVTVPAPAPVERQPPPLVAPVPTEATKRPRPPAKLVKPVEPATPRKKSAAKTVTVKAGSPSPDRATAARPARQSDPAE